MKISLTNGLISKSFFHIVRINEGPQPSSSVENLYEALKAIKKISTIFLLK